jgi:hypothetical protein
MLFQANQNITPQFSKVVHACCPRSLDEHVLTSFSPKDKYHVHKGLLRHYSGYFRTKFNGRWKVEKEIELAKEDTTTFGAFLTFIYHGRLQDRPLKKRKRQHEDQSDTQLNTPPMLTIEQLCKIYIFGDIYIIPLLKSCVTDAICLRLSSHAPESTLAIKYAFENTLEGSGPAESLHSYYAECRMPGTNSKSWSEHLRAERHNTHPDFTLEVLCRLFEQRLITNPDLKHLKHHDAFVKRNLCQYHDHKDIEDDAAAADLELVYSVTVGNSGSNG